MRCKKNNPNVVKAFIQILLRFLQYLGFQGISISLSITQAFYTLDFQIIVQVRIKDQAGKISKIDKSAGWNKAMQVGILGTLLL